MQIDFANLGRQTARYRVELDQAMQSVIDRSAFIMGDEVAALERALETFTGAKHAISCGSGTDALLLALMALGIRPGDEVITTPFTFIATAETIALLGAKPVFVDIDPLTYNINTSMIHKKISAKTKVILPVSLYGQPAKMDEIEEIAQKYQLKVIVDGAQSFGSSYGGKMDSCWGDISCTSFFPAKPLGCFGDGGALFTDDDATAEKIRALRVHGQNARYRHRYIGLGARLDTLQAAVLQVKLKHYATDLLKRQAVALHYDRLLHSKYQIPLIHAEANSAYAQYAIRVAERQKLQEDLKAAGVPTAVHYPLPLHLQACFAYLGYSKGNFPVAEQAAEEILCLPINPDMHEDEIDYICKHL